jgi:hypothetical protein
MIALNKQTLQKARRALQKAAALYLFDPNVSHIDYGFRIRESAGNRIEDELTIRVHLRKKLKGDAFNAFADKYPERVIDPKIIGFPTDIPEADYRLHYWWWGQENSFNTRRKHNDIMKGGISISNELSYGYGTLGGKVIDRQSGEQMILSNWHVLIGSWSAKPGLKIYQPAQGDGGNARDTVAVVKRDAMKDGVDAAVAKIDGTRSIVNEQLEIGPVTGVVSPRLGMILTKSGRGSDITDGIVTGTEGQSAIYYGGFRRIIKNVVHIAQVNTGNKVSSPGDSGSWWLEKDSRRVIGLHFAGSDNPEYALAISMPEVLNALDVEIALQ